MRYLPLNDEELLFEATLASFVYLKARGEFTGREELARLLTGKAANKP